jgi:tetratricopeptide (TPR) repeat protein
MTDHSIKSPDRKSGQSSEPARKTDERISNARRLSPFPGFRSNERMLGLAYAEVALIGGDPFHESEALRLLTNALKTFEPTAGDADFMTRLGFLHQQRGDFARAARAYEIALKVTPRRTDAIVNLGGIYAVQGRIEDALSLWREALQSNAGLTEAAINLALAYRSQEKLPQAREVLQRALHFDPDSGKARQLLKEIESALDKQLR